MKVLKLPSLNIAILGAILTFLGAALLTSCSKMDEYKKFTEGGEISYTGKLDSVRVLPGRYRVKVNGLFIADPKVKKTVIYWNNMADSMVVPVNRTANVDTLNVVVDDMIEGVHNFVIYTFDGAGNRSIPVYKTGIVFGDRYQGTLSNRAINSAFTDEANATTISWGGMDRLSGVFATEVTYKNLNDIDTTVIVPIDASSTALVKFKTKTTMKYRTLFLPDTSSIDTFYSSYTERYVPKYVKTDITNTYLVNTGTNVAYSSINSGNRWGILSGWTSNASVRNASGFGGYEKRSNVGFISLEAGWGLPNVPNGLIYQTITLPAGTYVFELNGINQNSGGTRYVAVAEGPVLPDVGNITSNSIAFASLSNASKLSFTLTKETQVSIGFAANLTGTGSTGQYIKIGSVRLYSEEFL